MKKIYKKKFRIELYKIRLYKYQLYQNRTRKKTPYSLWLNLWIKRYKKFNYCHSTIWLRATRRLEKKWSKKI